MCVCVPNKPREAGLEKRRGGKGGGFCPKAGHACQKANPNSRIGAPLTKKVVPCSLEAAILSKKDDSKSNRQNGRISEVCTSRAYAKSAQKWVHKVRRGGTALQITLRYVLARTKPVCKFQRYCN